MDAKSEDKTWPLDRAELRRSLLARRREWLAAHPGAQAQLATQLLALLDQLEPITLGLYWPLEGEFNAAEFAQNNKLGAAMQLALPYAYRRAEGPPRMDYRLWRGEPPTIKDECGIPSCAGPVLQPDVLLVPCLGFTREAFRMGYGGGYFDHWISTHPGVTTLGLAWSCGEAPFEVHAHDQALTLVLTEQELIAP